MASVLEQSRDTPKSLCDWVRNFRIKKVAMRRKRGGDLRVAAILTTALSRAEAELRRKQNERALRWSELQSKLLCKDGNRIANQLTTPTYDSECGASLYSDDDDMEKQRRQIESYWKCELSGLDDFFNSLSGSNKRSNDDLS